MRSCKGQYSLEVPEDAESVDAVFIIKRQMKYQIKFDDPTVLSIDVPLWFYFILNFCSFFIVLRRLIQLIKGYFSCLFCNCFKIFV